MPDLGNMSWQLMLVSGVFSSIGTVAFFVGKKREEILRMIWGIVLCGTSFLFADSWPKLLVSGIALSALIYFKPE